MLKQRVVTALILAPLFLVVLFVLPSNYFSLAIGLVCLLALWEWFGLCVPHNLQQRWVGLGLFVGLCVALTLWSPPALGILLAGSLWWVWSGHRLRREQTPADPPDVLWCALQGFIAVWAAWWSLSYLHIAAGAGIVFHVFALVWLADIGAYFAGRRYGRRKIAPRLSPGKTLEGLVGGLVCASAYALISGLWILEFRGFALMSWWILAILVALSSVLGDLVESQLKRRAGVKDSGSLLPGHGGVLDRVDSILAAAPIYGLGWLVMVSGARTA